MDLSQLLHRIWTTTDQPFGEITKHWNLYRTDYGQYMKRSGYTLSKTPTPNSVLGADGKQYVHRESSEQVIVPFF